MKRKNVVLEEHLPAQATALEEVIRRGKIQDIPHFFGTGIWEGDLSQMRQDRQQDGRRGVRRRKQS